MAFHSSVPGAGRKFGKDFYTILSEIWKECSHFSKWISLWASAGKLDKGPGFSSILVIHCR